METAEFRALVKAVVEDGRTLAREEARVLLEMLLGEPARYAPEGRAEPPVGSSTVPGKLLPEAFTLMLAALLAAMARRGETAEEVCGFAEAMRAAATPIPLDADERARLIDTCGTGGDGLDTFNISTAAGLVAAGAGAWIAKHGNRAVTSRCGSADVLEALGVPIELAPEQAVACLRASRFMFLLASGLHPAMRRVGPVRRALPFRTIFNLAGPLANPAGAAAQVVGVYAEERVPVVAEALRLLGVRHAWVVHGRVWRDGRVWRGGRVGHGDGVDRGGQVAGLEQEAVQGLDELTVTGPSVFAAVEGQTLQRGVIDPEALGLRVVGLAELRGGATAGENAALIEAVLRGQDRGARREIVLLNASAALVVAGVAEALPEGLERAAEAIDGGAAVAVLERLRAFGSGAR